MHLDEKKLTVEKLGLSQSDIYRIVVLRELIKEPKYPSAIYETIMQLSEKPRSRTQLFNVMKSMAQTGWITEVPTTDARLKMYAVTDEGRKKYLWYLETYHSSIKWVKQILEAIEYDMKRTGTRPTVDPLPDKHRTFISRLISVKSLIQYVTMKELLHRKNSGEGPHSVNATEIRDRMFEKYGWQASEGYVNDMFHQMERDGMLLGSWDDPERRKKRLYRLTDEGVNMIPRIEEYTAHTIDRTLDFVNSIIKIFD